MLTEQQLKQFVELREKLFDAIKRELEEDGHCKHYEGEFLVSMRFPNYFDREGPITWVIHLDMYLLGPHRHYDWIGQTFDECFEKVKHDVMLWINDSENEEWDSNREYQFEGWNGKYTHF